MIYLAVIIAVAVLGFVLSPFWLGPGGRLSAAASIDSEETLKQLKEAVLKHYVEEEKAHARGDLSALAWEKRRSFLVNKYIDAARRLDYLQGVTATSEGES